MPLGDPLTVPRRLVHWMCHAWTRSPDQAGVGVRGARGRREVEETSFGLSVPPIGKRHTPRVRRDLSTPSVRSRCPALAGVHAPSHPPGGSGRPARPRNAACFADSVRAISRPLSRRADSHSSLFSIISHSGARSACAASSASAVASARSRASWRQGGGFEVSVLNAACVR